MVAQLWESAWQRQPEAAGEGAWQQAAQARQETAGSWVAGPMALEASTKTDRFNNRNGQREYEVGVAIPLWMPGERASSARWADAESLALSSRMLAAKLRTAGQVRQAWWAWQRAQAELVAAQDRTRSADELAQDVARRVRAGDLAQADRNQADGALASARSALAIAQAEEITQREALLALTGIESIPSQADSAQPEQSGVRVQPASAQPSGALLGNHPALLELQHKALAARRSAELVSHQKYANPELTLATTRDRGGYGERYNQTITVGVRIPFGTGSRHTEQLSSANAQALEAESALAAQRTRLLSEIRTAQSRELATSTQMQAASERQRLAQQTRTFYQKSFAMGETDMPTRLRIEQEATEAERAALLAKVEHAAAISSLLQAQGTLPQPTETFTDISGTRLSARAQPSWNLRNVAILFLACSCLVQPPAWQ
ncbi:TolC family protein [Achromobacter xylosoxidans]|uniref:TolC family protein n=1 Tax=Alcaligenes xylosoxydans xylosoxydans TaxID=85698 RepID=UPI001F0F10F7|nr:TolC family protein [Achromobacter xylosoxidans]MCH4571539.1 TolC family protein [Achromobacter xylosoxidans]